MYCSSLQSVIIGKNVATIGYHSFEACTSLTSITIPSSVTCIEGSVFINCTSLTSISYNGTLSEWEKVYKFDYWNENCPATVVHCSDGDVAI